MTRAIEQVSRALLDNNQTMPADTQSKLISFIRECFQLCLTLLQENSDSHEAQITVLKMVGLVRSLVDCEALQLDYISII